jgi:hypothetical protein
VLEKWYQSTKPEKNKVHGNWKIVLPVCSRANISAMESEESEEIYSKKAERCSSAS